MVVRYLVQDEPRQSAQASALVDSLTENDPGFLSVVTVIELYWVLRRAYQIDTSTCAELIGGLLDARELRVEQDPVIRAALTDSQHGPDFADAVIAQLGLAASCEHTVTLDRRAARSDQMRLLG